MNTQGVSDTMPLLGLLLVAFILPLALLMRQAPGSNTSQRRGDAKQYRVAGVVGSRQSVLCTDGVGLCFDHGRFRRRHRSPHSRVTQIADFQTAAYAVQAWSSICSISGRFFGGWLVTRIPIRWFALGKLVFAGVRTDLHRICVQWNLGGCGRRLVWSERW